MKIYIMTDMECVAGVVSLPEYCLASPVNKYNRPEGGRYYDHARELATLEVNAVIGGLLEGGATEILVCDGHGHGGLDAALIHPRAKILTGKGQTQPRGLDDSFDAAVMIGQHAMANTDGGHLCHSGSFSRNLWQLNGQTIGEIGLFMVLTSHFNVPMVMISGDVAACQEAQSLVPSIETVAVIEGQKLGSTEGWTTRRAMDLNVPAVHVSPQTSRQMIHQAASKCLSRIETVERFSVEPSYEMQRVTRPDNDQPAQVAVNHSDDYVDLLGQKSEYEPI